MMDVSVGSCFLHTVQLCESWADDCVCCTYYMSLIALSYLTILLYFTVGPLGHPETYDKGIDSLKKRAADAYAAGARFAKWRNGTFYLT